MAKVSIQSMAKDLGLSRNTVSLALKGSEVVAPRTRELVLRYAESTGYLRPAMDGKGNMPFGAYQEEPPGGIKGEVYPVMILRKPDEAVYWDQIINGISEEASRNHCQTHVAVVSDEEEKRLLLPVGFQQPIRAVFCVKLLNRAYIQKIRQMGIPVFLLDDSINPEEEPLGDIIKTEGFQPVAKLTRHLISQGRKRIAFLSEGSSQYETMHDRLSGYLYAMAEAGLEVEDRLLLPDGFPGWGGKKFYETATFDKIIEQFGTLPEAVVCGNDSIAKFLTQAFRRNGIRVPEDVAITGFDNDEEGMLDPFFTTVGVDPRHLGQRMVQCFLWRLEHPESPYEKITVFGKIIFRRSSMGMEL